MQMFSCNDYMFIFDLKARYQHVDIFRHIGNIWDLPGVQG